MAYNRCTNKKTEIPNTPNDTVLTQIIFLNPVNLLKKTEINNIVNTIINWPASSPILKDNSGNTMLSSFPSIDFNK